MLHGDPRHGWDVRQRAIWERDMPMQRYHDTMFCGGRFSGIHHGLIRLVKWASSPNQLCLQLKKSALSFILYRLFACFIYCVLSIVSLDTSIYLLVLPIVFFPLYP